MTKKRPRFVFADDLRAITNEHDLVVRLPADIRSKIDLFTCYQREGGFPSYFGRNWDALPDCLRDFSWVAQRRIIVNHEDIPLENRIDERRVYLEILDTAITDWQTPKEGPLAVPPFHMPYIKHELVAIFPAGAEQTITRVLTHRGKVDANHEQ